MQFDGWMMKECVCFPVWCGPQVAGRASSVRIPRRPRPLTSDEPEARPWTCTSTCRSFSFFLPMAFDDDEDACECPVCYEGLRGTERTLSCGHEFCHDCLVKMLVSIHADSHARDTIACPVCRHLTFIRKSDEEPLVAAESKEELQEDHRGGGAGGQTLEVPVGTPPARLEDAASAAPLCGRLRRFFRGDSDPERPRRQRLIRTSPGGTTEIFVISTRGRPMMEEDTFSVLLTVVRPRRRRRRRLCSTARCLLVLLSTFTLMALVAAVLPWILLA
ncbi:RING finger protein 222 [Syngnathoides biaculeatus]|uniref:RING finger protein 222 n=1 Tax=Syngnathoides biaculeatus TaxID=300417 RepID=UPI002ADD437A|nr:RING finger protein 222 [Syngnathoides biaculeatus]